MFLGQNLDECLHINVNGMEKTLSVIDRYFPSSQICHCCGHRDSKKSEDIRIWSCPACNSELDRDVKCSY